MSYTLPPLTIRPDSAFPILLKAREFDDNAELVEAGPIDPVYDDLIFAIGELDDDEIADLIALIWLGRHDFMIDEWADALAAARDIGRTRAPLYVAGIPLVSDCLEDGMQMFGHSLKAYLDAA